MIEETNASLPTHFDLRRKLRLVPGEYAIDASSSEPMISSLLKDRFGTNFAEQHHSPAVKTPVPH